ncbi:MAG: glycosyl hydrolase [Gammaproteobacteria bacterium]
MRRIMSLIAVCLFALGAHAQDDAPPKPGLNEATLKGLSMRSIGPALSSGRISDIVIHPDNPRHWYVAVGSGGIFETVNGGTTWTPIFEDQTSYSIGSITLDPNNPSTIWVGTGENVSGRHMGFGDGVYRSDDGGASWTNMGLKDSERIGMIRVDPRDSDVVFVAAQGPLWSGGGDRGLFKTTDGGKNWNKILGGNEYTGVGEVHLDPRNPDVLYANTWQRLRSVAGLMNGGPDSGIHKSTDGGDTWTKLSKGLPDEVMGKIGLAISQQKPDVIYAQIELSQRKGGFWRSTDGGTSWEKRSEYMPGGTGPHYYTEIFASPHTFDTIYQMDVWMHISTDGGKTFTKTDPNQKHSDHHALAFDATNPRYLLAGTDGGVYETFDSGATWMYSANLPITQFYKVAVDYDEPFYNVYGGTQDNQSQGGPSRTDNVLGIRNSDWFITLGGDGHQSAVDPTNPNIVYAEWQQGNLTRYDRATGESVYIQPQPAEDEPNERFNWDAPILISAHDPARLYFASQRVWRSDDRGDSWRAISDDLSRGIDRFTLPMMGRVWSYDSPWDLYAMSKFGSITSLAESPLNESLIYAGTDDGVVQTSEDGGRNWRRTTTLPGVPEFFFVNDIKADLFDENTVYLAADDHKTGDFRPFLLRSRDRGRTWQSMRGDLPDRHLVWRLVQDHVNKDMFFAGTEFGVFVTLNAGRNWVKLSGGVPNIPFRDLVIQKRENDLVGATFGRGFYIFDDFSPLRELSAQKLQSENILFKPRDAHWYVPKRPFGCAAAGCKSSMGSQLYIADNPPFGAVITYYLNEDILSLKDARREREKALEKAGSNTPYPGWDGLKAEAVEDAPVVILTVRDADGNVVQRIDGPVKAGFHRIAWDLRYPDAGPWSEASARPPWQPPAAGVMAPPGTYSVTMAVRRDGKLGEESEAQEFNVVSIRKPTLMGPSQTERLAFSREVEALMGQARGDQRTLGEVDEAMKKLKSVIGRSSADSALYAQTHALHKRVLDLKERLGGNPQRDIANDPGPVAILDRVGVASFGERSSLYGPTTTQKTSLDIAKRQYAELTKELDTLLGKDLPALKSKLDAAGTPWSPGLGLLRSP